MPPGGLNIRTPDGFLEQEARLQEFKRDAMLAFVRANNLNHIVLSGGRQPKIGIITVGKSYLDVRQALDELGIDEVKANDMGLRLYKVACPWPLSQRRAGRVRARPRAHHRRRGEALADRGAGPRGALRHVEPAGLHRQEGRERQLAVPGEGRARPQRHRDRHRRAAAEISQQRRSPRPRLAPEAGPGDARRDERRRRAHAAFLLRLPAQHLDHRAGGHARLCRHRLPLHGAVDGPRDRRLHADGRRGRQLDRRMRTSRPASTSSRTSATAPTTTRARWRCAGRSTPRPRSPTRSCSTTPSP